MMKDELPIVVIDSVLCMDDWYPKGLALIKRRMRLWDQKRRWRECGI